MDGNDKKLLTYEWAQNDSFQTLNNIKSNETNTTDIESRWVNTNISIIIYNIWRYVLQEQQWKQSCWLILWLRFDSGDKHLYKIMRVDYTGCGFYTYRHIDKKEQAQAEAYC